jgi:hypothetical protein
MDSCDSFEGRGGTLCIKVLSSVEAEILVRVRHVPHTLKKILPVLYAFLKVALALFKVSLSHSHTHGFQFTY